MRRLLVLPVLLASTLVAAPAAAAEGRVRGTVVAPGDPTPPVRVTWFRTDGTYVGSRRVLGGEYSFGVEPGVYRLQFSDPRPSSDLEKYAPYDVTLSVADGATTVEDVRMRTGGAIGGTVRAGGRPAARARIVVADQDQHLFGTTADNAGRFALGGLKAGSYSVFTYDQRERFVGRSRDVARLRLGVVKRVGIDLTTRAGRFVVDLYAGSETYPVAAYVTAVSRRTGQSWTELSRRGRVRFAGLYPGRYDVTIPGTVDYAGATVPIDGRVRSGTTSHGTARLTDSGH